MHNNQLSWNLGLQLVKCFKKMPERTAFRSSSFILTAMVFGKPNIYLVDINNWTMNVIKISVCHMHVDMLNNVTSLCCMSQSMSLCYSTDRPRRWDPVRLYTEDLH